MKKITHYDAVIRMKDSKVGNNEEEHVTIKVDKDFDIETATDQQIKDDEDIFFYIDQPEEIGELMDEQNPNDFVVLRAVPVFEEEENDNLFHFIDIHEAEVTPDFMFKIGDSYTYQDKILNEHLWGIEHIKEKLLENGIVLGIGNEAILKGIEKRMAQHDAAYFRIIERK